MFTDEVKQLTDTEQLALKELVRYLHQHYGDDLLLVTLFGSKARDDYDEESDLDLFIVLRMANGTYRQYWNEIVEIMWDIELEYNVVTSFVLKSEEQYNAMKKDALLLFRNIRSDGVELWTRQKSERIFDSV